MLVIDKPSGIAVHAGPRRSSLEDGSTRCASLAAPRRWRTASTATPAAAWFSDATRRHCGVSAIVPEGGSRRCIGPSLPAFQPSSRRHRRVAEEADTPDGWRMEIDPAGQRR